jgi:hypothetical protein
MPAHDPVMVYLTNYISIFSYFRANGSENYIQDVFTNPLYKHRFSRINVDSLDVVAYNKALRFGLIAERHPRWIGA